MIRLAKVLINDIVEVVMFYLCLLGDKQTGWETGVWYFVLMTICAFMNIVPIIINSIMPIGTVRKSGLIKMDSDRIISYIVFSIVALIFSKILNMSFFLIADFLYLASSCCSTMYLKYGNYFEKLKSIE